MSEFKTNVFTGNSEKELRDYIVMLNQQIEYCFHNITPEDNFTADELTKYTSSDGYTAQMEMVAKQIQVRFESEYEQSKSELLSIGDRILLKIDKGDVCSEISLSSERITFNTGSLIINSKNFSLDRYGNASFSGRITGGNINIGSGNFTVNSNGIYSIRNATCDGDTDSNLVSTLSIVVDKLLDLSDGIRIDGYAYSKGHLYYDSLSQYSDERIKENITVIPDEECLDTVMKLKPCVFTYKGKTDHMSGYIAQEAADASEFLPMVSESPDGYLSINYSSYNSLYVGAIKHQLSQLEYIESRLKEEQSSLRQHPI